MAKLTAKERNSLPASAFVFPKDRRYPIHNASHAQNALARSAGTVDEAAVKAAVRKRYPSMMVAGSKRHKALMNRYNAK